MAKIRNTTLSFSKKCTEFGLRLLFSVGFLFVLDSVEAASIEGHITFEGKVPKMKNIKMDADPICLSHHGDAPAQSEMLVLGEGNKMANIFVRVKSGLTQTEYETPREAVVLNQKGCQYSPHVFGVRVGQTLEILNPDGTLHNVHAMSKTNKEFNMAMPKFKKKARKKFDSEEFMFLIKCDVHPWMKTWCAVMAHPFFSVTQKEGHYSIDGLEAGTYEIEAWHEKLGPQSQTVTITGDEKKTLDFIFKKS